MAPQRCPCPDAQSPYMSPPPRRKTADVTELRISGWEVILDDSGGPGVIVWVLWDRNGDMGENLGVKTTEMTTECRKSVALLQMLLQQLSV